MHVSIIFVYIKYYNITIYWLTGSGHPIQNNHQTHSVMCVRFVTKKKKKFAASLLKNIEWRAGIPKTENFNISNMSLIIIWFIDIYWQRWKNLNSNVSLSLSHSLTLSCSFCRHSLLCITTTTTATITTVTAAAVVTNFSFHTFRPFWQSAFEFLMYSTEAAVRIWFLLYYLVFWTIIIRMKFMRCITLLLPMAH